jgi:hypothetical protein
VIEAVGVLRRVLDRAVRGKAIAQNPCTMRSRSLPSGTRLNVRSSPPPRSKPWPVRWSDVDLPRGMLTVRQSVEDSPGPLTTITLPTALVADLARLETDGLVFANRAGGYLRYGNWRNCWNHAVK